MKTDKAKKAKYYKVDNNCFYKYHNGNIHFYDRFQKKWGKANYSNKYFLDYWKNLAIEITEEDLFIELL